MVEEPLLNGKATRIRSPGWYRIVDGIAVGVTVEKLFGSQRRPFEVFQGIRNEDHDTKRLVRFDLRRYFGRDRKRGVRC